MIFRVVSFVIVAAIAASVARAQEIIVQNQRGANVTTFTSFERPGFMGPVQNPQAFDNPKVQVGPALFSNGGISATRNNPSAYLTGCFVWITLNQSTIDVSAFPNKVNFFAKDVNLAGDGLEVGGILTVEFQNGRKPIMVGVPEFFKGFKFNNVKRITITSQGPGFGVTNLDDFTIRSKRPPGRSNGRKRR